MPREDGARLFDCFLFFRELDLLEIRLTHLADHVHRFVLVEAVHDFAGNRKPLYYADNRARYAQFADRIEHVVLDREPAGLDGQWLRQRWQRDQVLHGLGGARPDDIVMISDLDEIPTHDALCEAMGRVAGGAAAVLFEMPTYAFRLDLLRAGRPIVGSRMVRRRHFRVPHLVRQFKRRYWKSAPDVLDAIPFAYHALHASGQPLRRHVLADAGWHFSWVGSRDFAAAKVAAFTPDEGQSVGNGVLDLAAAVAAGTMDGAAAGTLTPVPLSALPAAIRDNAGRYGHLLAGL